MKRGDSAMALRLCLAMFLVLCLTTARPVRAADAPTPPAEHAVSPSETTAASETTVPGEKWPADAPRIPGKVRALMQDRDYPAAIHAIDEAMAADDAPKAYLAYLKGRAHYFQQDYPAAVAAFEAVEKDFAASDWARPARFGKALALARQGNFQAAGAILGAEADYLLSDDRKQQLVDIYLEFADALAHPPHEDEHPDYAKARQFYQQALQAGPKPEKQIEIEMQVGRCQQELKDFGPACELFARLIDKHLPTAVEIEARYRLGQCLMAQGDSQRARQTWEDLLAAHRDDAAPQIAEAQFELAHTWGVPQPSSDGDLNQGAAALRAFIERFPAHRLASRAYLELAQSYLSRGRQEEAAAALRQFLGDDRYAAREEVPEARNLLGQAYQAQKKFAEAIAVWQEYLVKNPAHKAWSEVQREIVDCEYLLACEKLAAKQYDAANALFAEFLTKHPLDERGPRILALMNAKAVAEKHWDEAIANWRRIIAKYPESDEAATAQLRIAETLENELGKYEEAIEQYRKLTEQHKGEASQTAGNALARLNGASMTIATERVFRSNETPAVKLVSRNVEKVTVRLYPIDLEAYFRKMHGAEGVEGLDIDLIDPERTFEFSVPKYAKYQQFANAIEVPLPAEARAGAMAVTVSSDKLTATTLVLQSDLDVIVKSSRDEVFVFAENLRTGKPWAAARVLLSNGAEVFANGVTGPDGVFRRGLSGDDSVDDSLGVFAIAEGHVASNAVGLSGVGVAEGLSDTGYIFTDCGDYLPGETVFLRGCIRRAEHDNFTIEQGRPYTLTVFDSRNRQMARQPVELDAFGCFACRVDLPATSPQGRYRVLLHDEGGTSPAADASEPAEGAPAPNAAAAKASGRRDFDGSFNVAEFRLAPVRLTIDVPHAVYYRGEEIEGTIRASYYYGAPLAGRAIRYQWANGRTYDAKTDAQGEVRFKLPTREFSESRVLRLVVGLADENLQQTANFYLATRAFRIGVRTPRRLYVAGEPFEVTVQTVDAAGKPTAEKLTLKALRQTTVEGKVGESLVAEQPVATGDDGLGRADLKLDAGGAYVLRVEGTDRFQNPVSAACLVAISDDEDQTRLRILADNHTFKVGDKPTIKVHWREAPTLALVAFEGERILDYRLVELQTGDNQLPLEMNQRLAPNFQLAVAAMIDRPAARADGAPAARFHEATSPFVVERQLQLQLAVRAKDAAAAKDGTAPNDSATPKDATPPKDPGDATAQKTAVFQPGQEVEVEVITTDPQGQPVAAELSLALIEQALLDRAGVNRLPLAAVFRGLPRKSAIRTAASIAFDYHPSTQAINPRLLAEEDRLAMVAEEAASREAVQRQLARNAAGAADPFGGFLRDPAESGRIVVQEDESAEFIFTGTRSTTSGLAATDGSIEPDGGSVSLGGLVRQYPVADLVSPMKNGTVDWWAHEEMSLNLGYPQSGGYDFSVRPFPHFATGYWNPSIVTGDDGRATVVVKLPDRSTAWRLMAAGITTDTLAGEANAPLVTRKDLFGQLKLPQGFTAGDRAEVLVTIVNNAFASGQVQVALAAKIGERSVEQTKILDIQAKGPREVSFPVELSETDAAAADHVDFTLTVAAVGRGETDVVRQRVPLRPYGMMVSASGGGTADADTALWIAPPTGVKFQNPRMTIFVGPTVEASLLDVLFAPPAWCEADAFLATSGLEADTSDLLAALGLRSLAIAAPAAVGPRAREIGPRIDAAISALVSSQDEAGGWGYFARSGRPSADDLRATARALWALAAARKAGFEVPNAAFDIAIRRAQSSLQGTTEDNLTDKAVLLHALSAAGKGDFALANRLYRQRLQLSPAALAHLALAMIELDRQPIAAELLTDLGQRVAEDSPEAGLAGFEQFSGDATTSATELRALWLLGLEQVEPLAPQASGLVQRLLSGRAGNRWSPDAATGPAALALAQWFAKQQFQGERYRLAITVNGAALKTLDVDPAAGTQAIDVPAALLKPDATGGQQVAFQLTGRGRFAYECVLGGYVPAEELKSTTRDWSVARTYQPAQLEIEGRKVPRGQGGVQGRVKPIINPLSQLPLGGRALVDLTVSRPLAATANGESPAKRRGDLIVREPIPAGAEVILDSVQGGFEWFELAPGAITFYLGERRESTPIHYELHGYLPGQYRVAPTLVRSAQQSGRWAVAEPKSLAVLPAGAKSADPYQLSSEELLALGKHAFEQGDMQIASERLGQLLKEYSLQSDTYRQVVRMLLDIHLEIGPPAEVVRYFEIVKEKWPAEEISFAKIMRVAAAYRAMGEFERGYLVYRATVEGRFQADTGAAGFLEAQGQFLRGVDLLARLLREYPPENYVAEARYALAQHVLAKAPQAADDPELRKAKINRVDLTSRAHAMLESFLSEHPDDPADDQAAFTAATALLDMKEFEAAAAACARSAARYPKSPLLDAYWYVIGYCRFADGKYDEALEMCRKVAESRPVDPATGRAEESRNKWRAIYIRGQIYHSLGEAAAAIREYRQVEDKFSDAAQAIDEFLRKEIELPETVLCKPGEPAQVELKFRNVAACDLKVYRIDLMKFSLMRRSLRGLADINLAGIRPLHEETIALGDGKDYRTRTRQLALPLEEEGAYLVVCRGDDLYASGLVLRTRLAVEVDVVSDPGRVRTTVKDAVADKHLSGVQVRVIGRKNADFVAGATDLRGVFVADGIAGAATVIAQTDEGEYAFYRAADSESGGAAVRRSVAVRQSPRQIVMPAMPMAPPTAPLAAANAPSAGGVWSGISYPPPTLVEQRIEAALDSPTQIDAAGTPLSGVVQDLARRHGINIALDQRALNDVGVSPDTPVTQQLRGTSLRSALELMLRQFDLDTMVRDETLVITTPEEAENELETRVYPVGDLVILRDETGADYGFDSLINLINSTIAPTSWDNVGGKGALGPFEANATIVMSQTRAVHRQVEQFLTQLRAATADAKRSGRELPKAEDLRRLVEQIRSTTWEEGNRGMGGGMGGGMSGGGDGRAVFENGLPQLPSVELRASPSQQPPAAEGDLLEGVQQTKQGLQQTQQQNLQRLYRGGNGSGAMGGGGINAGDAY